MRKWASLPLALVLVLMVGSLSWAAVNVSGNLRVWYQTEETDNVESDGFRFDRLALVFAAPLSETSGINSELRFKFTGDEAVSLAATKQKVDDPVTEVSIGNKIRVHNAYYYRKAVLTENDELDIGYFPIDFANGDYNGLLVGSVADGFLGPDNHLGVKYIYIAGKFQGMVGFVNATSYNSSQNDGYDYALRVTYQPLGVLTFGIGVARDASVVSEYDIAGQVAVKNKADKYTVDALFKQGAWAILTEYAYQSLETTKRNLTSEFDGKGSFSEVSYTINPKLTSYLGVTIDAKAITTNDYQYFGTNYLLSDKTKLTGELVRYQNGDYQLGFRFRVDF
jgi:hypothetical protein